jgi:hypothetical protein
LTDHTDRIQSIKDRAEAVAQYDGVTPEEFLACGDFGQLQQPAQELAQEDIPWLLNVLKEVKEAVWVLFHNKPALLTLERQQYISAICDRVCARVLEEGS